MPPNRRLCSLASGIVTIFFCLSFIADQLDPRRGIFAPEVDRFSSDPPRPQTLLSLLNMSSSFQAQSSSFHTQGFQDSRQTQDYYGQAAQNYQQRYNLQTQNPRQLPSFHAQGVVEPLQAASSYGQETHDSQQGSNFQSQGVLDPHQLPNSQPQGLENPQHAPNSHVQQGFLNQGNFKIRGPRNLANPYLSTNSQPQGPVNKANSHHTSNIQPQTPLDSQYISNSEPQVPLNSGESFHRSTLQNQGLLNPFSSQHRSNSQPLSHQPLNSQPQALQALQEPTYQAQALRQTHSQLPHASNSQTRPHPHPRDIASTATPSLIPGFSQPTNSDQSTPKQPPNNLESTPNQPSQSSFNQPSINPQSTAERGYGQCKKKYWRCDSPPTDPEPPLEDLQEPEDLPAHPFTAPHWSQYANRGYTVVVSRNQSASKSLPDVLIIGAKKSGTRALLAFLRVHPSIRASGPELHYFDRFYAKGLDWYRSKLPLSLAGQLTVEKTPAYFTTPGVPARVKQDLPDAKLLLVVRDPVTRALSDYTQSLSKHRSRRPFEELAFVRASPGLVNSDWGPISGGLYARHLQRWLDYFPRASIHVVSGENLVRDPAAELCKVQEFLGLRKVITEKHFFFNVTKGFPCLVKREKTGRPHCLGSSKGRSHPTVSQATLNTLRDFYRPFNFKFYKMVGQNFRW